MKGVYAEQAALYGAETPEAVFDNSFGTINDGKPDSEAWESAHDVLETARSSLKTILSEKLKAALSPGQIKRIQQKMQEVEQRLDGSKKLLERAEKRTAEFSEESKADLARLKAAIGKTGIKDFVTFRREYSCKISKSPEYAILGMLEAYRSLNAQVWKLSGRELMEHMDKNCPKILAKMKKLKSARFLKTYFQSVVKRAK